MRRTCPRCQGRLFDDGTGEITCLQCGHVAAFGQGPSLTSSPTLVAPATTKHLGDPKQVFPGTPGKRWEFKQRCRGWKGVSRGL